MSNSSEIIKLLYMYTLHYIFKNILKTMHLLYNNFVNYILGLPPICYSLQWGASKPKLCNLGGP